MIEPAPEPLPVFEETNAINIARPFFEKYADNKDVFVIGGLGSAALSHPDMQLSSTDKVIAVPDLTVSRRRIDGTVRDIDVLVTSRDDRETLAVEWCLADTIRDELGVSVCNIANGDGILQDIRQPFHIRTLPSGFTSNRYSNPFPELNSELVRYIFPFVAPLPAEHFDQWHVEVKDSGVRIPVPPPASTLSNYLVRSVIGLRPADNIKVPAAARAVFKQSEEQEEWLFDGPGKEQVELATILRSLRYPNVGAVELLPHHIHRLYSHDELAYHDMFAPSKLGYWQRRLVLAGSLGKNAATRVFEEQPKMKAWFRERFEEKAVAISDRRHSHGK